MARYTGPKTRIARKFGEPIYGPDKYFEKRNTPPGQHGLAAKRKKTKEYGTQLKEKQKVKYMYGVLERQFRNTYEKAARMKGQTGVNLVLLLESRLDNIVYRLGFAPLMGTTLNQDVQDAQVKYIANIIDLDELQAAYATWHDMGGDQILAEYQAVHDAQN